MGSVHDGEEAWPKGRGWMEIEKVGDVREQVAPFKGLSYLGVKEEYLV